MGLELTPSRLDDWPKELKDVEFPWEMCILAKAVQNTALKIFWTEIFGKFSVGILVEGDY